MTQILGISLLSCLVAASPVQAFVTFSSSTTTATTDTTSSLSILLRSNTKNDNRFIMRRHVSNAADDFASFAASLEEDESSSSDNQQTKKDLTTTSAKKTKPRGWQDTLEDLLAPATPLNRRQELLTDLMSANQDIRSSFESALRDRTIDPLLTPRGKRLREGSRAVARQLTSDILPQLMQQNQNRAVAPPSVQELQKINTRVFNALQSRLQADLETMQNDIQNDPLRSIPQRIQSRSRDIIKEASNVFAETPDGLEEPSYTVVSETADYEIRDYAGYSVASTNMAPLGEEQDYSLAQNGAAFNTLVAYTFGANKEGVSMEMTTPVTTTSSGEMRFFLASDDVHPEPLEQDESTNIFERPGSIMIQDIPSARLAVRRFTGFCTKGEVARQKEALLASLDFDAVELDVPHGKTVPHVVFQYNPPYTLPVLRRNEIAVAVTKDVVTNGSRRSNGVPKAATQTDKDSSPEESEDGESSIRDSWEPVE